MKKKLFFYVITGLIIYGCIKDDLPVGDPQEAILGRWELVRTNLGTEDNPSGFEEFLPDSLMRFYDYKEKQYYYQKYFLNDSLLTKEFKYFDSIDGDTIFLSEPYKYEFSNINKLILNFQYPAIQTTFIYKRIN